MKSDEGLDEYEFRRVIQKRVYIYILVDEGFKLYDSTRE